MPRTLDLPYRGIPKGKLIHDGWHDSGRTDALDSWIGGFNTQEIAALGGYFTVRAIYWFANEDGPANFTFDVYDDRPNEDILEPVIYGARIRQAPRWLQRRIRRILPPVPIEEEENR